MKLWHDDFSDVEYNIELNESTGEKTYVIKGVVSTPEKKNRNGRIYPKKLWEKEVTRYINEDINNNSYNTLCEWEHPPRSSVDIMKAVAKCRKVWWEDNQVMGEFVILNNNSPETNQLKALIEQGLPIGVSTRGVGRLKGNVVEEYKWITTDLVASPSNHASMLTGITESLQENFDENGILKDKEYNITEDGKIICDESGCRLEETNEKVECDCNKKAEKLLETLKEYAKEPEQKSEFTEEQIQKLYEKGIINTEKYNKLMESCVGCVGRTGYKDAEEHISNMGDIKKVIRKLLKEVGGKTVLLKIINTMNSGV